MATELIPRKISQLPNPVTATGAEKIPIIQGGTTKGATLEWVREYVGFEGLKPKLEDLPTGDQIADQLDNRLRFDGAQSLTTEEKQQAEANIGFGNIDPLAYYILAKS